MSDHLLALLPIMAAVVIVSNGFIVGVRWWWFAIVVAQSVALLWSRRAPLAVVIVTFGLEAVLPFGGTVIFVGPLVAAYCLGAWARRLHQRIGLAIGIAVIAGLTVLGIAQATLTVALLFAGFWGAGLLQARRRERVQSLEAEQRAAEQERSLFAWDLHDVLNHSLTAMVLDAEAAAETGDDTETRDTLRRMAQTGRESLAELRHLLGILRAAPMPLGHDPLAAPRGLDQIEELVGSVPVSGPRVRLNVRGPVRRVEPSIGMAAYRVVQESLTNVAKHAGPVEVEVEVAYLPDSLTVAISNTAPVSGPARLGGGTGLVGMRERVDLLGGSLHAGPAEGGGFEVRASLPLRSAA